MALFKRKKRTDEEESQKQAENPKEEDKKLDKSEKKEESGKSMKDLYKSEQTDREAKKETKSPEKEAKLPEKETKEPAFSGKGYSRAYRVLIRPLVTEKISDMGEQNKYAFEVSLDANKVEVSKSIKGVYGIDPEKVNIIKMKGKRVTLGRLRGKRKDWKKAIVTLPKGKTINVYEGM